MHKYIIDRKIFVPVAIGIIFVLIQLVFSIREQKIIAQQLIDNPKYIVEYSPVSLYNGSLFTAYYSNISTVFFNMLPFLVSFCSILNSFDLKLNKSKKIALAFVAGMVTCFLFISEDLILCSMFLPAFKPEIFSGYFPIIDAFGGELYYNNPVLYLILYSILDMLFCGALSLFFSSLCGFCKYRLEALALPVIFSVVLNQIGKSNMKIDYLIPANHIRPSQSKYDLNLKIILIEFCLLIVLSLLNYFIQGRYGTKNE